MAPEAQRHKKKKQERENQENREGGKRVITFCTVHISTRCIPAVIALQEACMGPQPRRQPFTQSVLKLNITHHALTLLSPLPEEFKHRAGKVAKLERWWKKTDSFRTCMYPRCLSRRKSLRKVTKYLLWRQFSNWHLSLATRNPLLTNPLSSFCVAPLWIFKRLLAAFWQPFYASFTLHKFSPDYQVPDTFNCAPG